MTQKEIARIIKRYMSMYGNLVKTDKTSLARIILSENPDIVLDSWKNPEETIRSRIRYYVGMAGEKSKHNKDIPIGGAKILIYDIEVLPLRAFVWGVFKQFIDTKTSLITDRNLMLTHAYKWLGEDEVFYDALTPEEIEAEDDSRIVLSLSEAMNEADIIIGYNLDRYDNRHVNAHRARLNLSPLNPFESIDLMKVAKKQFYLIRYTLAYVCSFLGLEQKTETGGMQLWIDCWKGKQDAIDKMVEYNIQDVKLTEDLYMRMRAWIHNHPNMNHYVDSDVDVCPKCGSHDLEYIGEKRTQINAFDAYKCRECGGLIQKRLSNLNKDTRPRLKSM